MDESISDKQMAVAEKVQKKVRKAMKKLAVLETSLSGAGSETIADDKRNELLQEKYRLKQEVERLRYNHNLTRFPEWKFPLLSFESVPLTLAIF